MNCRILLLLPILLFSLSNTSEAQTVPEVQMPIISKIAATWCGPCGTWGWSLFEGLLEDNTDKAIFLNTHYSGDLLSAVSSDFASNLGANGQPKFYIDNTNTLATSNTVAAKRMEIAQLVTEANAKAPVANAGLEFTLTDDVYSINTKTKFFQEMSGNVHLSIIVLESKVMNNQASIGLAEHTFVVRASESGNSFGPMIASGTIDAGTEIDGSYTVAKEGNWNLDNVTLVALLWTEENGDYTYINGSFGVEAVVNSLSTDLGNDFVAQWRTNAGQNELFIDTNKDLGLADINVFNVNGQLVSTLFQAKMTAGVYHLPVEQLTAGNYFIEITTEKGSETIKAQF